MEQLAVATHAASAPDADRRLGAEAQLSTARGTRFQPLSSMVRMAFFRSLLGVTLSPLVFIAPRGRFNLSRVEK
jgi:hypothetical protein